MRYPSIDELRVRGSQKINSLTERLAWSSQLKVPSVHSILDPKLTAKTDSDQALLDLFRSRTQPKFFQGFAEEEGAVQLFRTEWPEEALLIIKSADQLLKGSFNLLGYRGLSFGDEIDWHFEPVTRKRIPLVHWSQLDYLDANVAGDKKIVWELNRHQYFVTLGQAYSLTGDEKYAEGFVAHIESWMDQNPPKLGINWASSLEIAFRSISWIWAIYYFRKSPIFHARTFSRILTFLHLNARHIERYLSTYFSPNTHLTGEALALFYLGTLFPELKDARRWKKKGNDILLGELSRHVRPDGVYFEQSSYYHRYTVDFYTHYLILMQENGNVVPTIVRDALSSMTDHLMYITRPDGKTPLFGDDDGGRLVKLDLRDLNDFRSTLATAAVVFQRPDYKFVAREATEGIFWMFGTKGIETFAAIAAEEPKETSKAFPDGGYYVLRDGWSSKASYLLFDCGPHGSLNSGHSHADALGFELVTNGQTQLVDPGTYTYTGSKEWRDWFRSSPAHNTLTLDGESSSVLAGPFSWRTKAQGEALKWITDRRFDYIEAQHDGYRRLSHPAEHTRSILFIKK
ncbi:MAG TPA: alginate lyase family protein, partial [Pyrinomonadaceae bacterium]|nr:alginate lyase family protein [Pyrinomonadaceae bacterium]